MMLHPNAVFGLSDGGAHCGLICDASMPSYLLTHWARDRNRGERIPLEQLVHNQTRRTAEFYGMQDRGPEPTQGIMPKHHSGSNHQYYVGLVVQNNDKFIYG